MLPSVRGAQHNTDRSIREESQCQSEHRTHDESSGVSFVPSDCGAPYYTDRAAQFCSVCNTQRSSDGDFFQWCTDSASQDAAIAAAKHVS